MKKLVLLLLAAHSISLPLLAQDSTKARKNYDAKLPAWCLDINLKGGMLMQDLTIRDIASYYTNRVNPSIGTLKYENGMSLGFDAQLGYFFGKNRHWGVGAGLLYMRQTGDVTLDKFHIEYQSVDYRGDVFRQSLTATGAVKEEWTTTNISIPVVAKYKNQFGKKWGFAMDAGILYNLQLRNSYTTNASFDYEAIYAYQVNGTTVTTVYDANPVPDANDWLITKQHFIDKNPGGSVVDTFNALRSQGYNVGLGVKPNSTSGDASYQSGSLGFLVKPSLSYLIADNVALDFGVYYAYQTFKAEDKNYRITDKLGEYSSLTNGVKTAVSNNIGLNVGTRIYFGKAKDTDGDGIPDKRDQCPDVFGLEQFGGCPDTDKDGIPDKEDKCPDIAGVAAFQGCPDTDGDGITDAEDNCPMQKGSIEMHGCPDRDGDGIADKDDACPDQKGLAEFHGCPDTDRDGIADNEDKCPLEAGPASNNGCPVPPPVEEPVVQTIDISTPVLFDVNKTTIKEESFPILDEAARKLVENKDLYLNIDGHTDNTGSLSYNNALSQKRAAVVKKYLMSKGVRAKQLKAKGYGPKLPIAPNDTDDGRSKNRRVIMKLK